MENWHETEAFAKARDVEAKTIREIQCCLNSEQCDLSRAQQEAVDCSAYVSEVSNERALFRAERFVVSKTTLGRIGRERLAKVFLKSSMRFGR